MFESFRKEKCLSDQLIIWNRHSNRSEKLLEVVRKFRSTPVMFTSWIHCNKNTRIFIDFNSSTQELKRRLRLLDCPLYDLDLLWDCRELFFKQSVKFIEAPPCPALDEANEYSTHCLVVKTLITIKDQYLPSKCLSKCFNTFSLTSSSRPVRVTSVTHFHSKYKSKITFVRERCVHKFGSVSLIFECVVEEGIAHSNLTLICLLNVNVIFKLFEPHPIIHVLGLNNAVLRQKVNDLNVVNNVQNQRLYFWEQ